MEWIEFIITFVCIMLLIIWNKKDKNEERRQMNEKLNELEHKLEITRQLVVAINNRNQDHNERIINLENERKAVWLD